MLYLLVYGEKNAPEVDVILCDNHPDRTSDGTLISRMRASLISTCIRATICLSSTPTSGARRPGRRSCSTSARALQIMRARPLPTREMCSECLR